MLRRAQARGARLIAQRLGVFARLPFQHQRAQHRVAPAIDRLAQDLRDHVNVCHPVHLPTYTNLRVEIGLINSKLEDDTQRLVALANLLKKKKYHIGPMSQDIQHQAKSIAKYLVENVHQLPQSEALDKFLFFNRVQHSLLRDLERVARSVYFIPSSATERAKEITKQIEKCEDLSQLETLLDKLSPLDRTVLFKYAQVGDDFLEMKAADIFKNMKLHFEKIDTEKNTAFRPSFSLIF